MNHAAKDSPISFINYCYLDDKARVIEKLISLASICSQH